MTEPANPEALDAPAPQASAAPETVSAEPGESPAEPVAAGESVAAAVEEPAPEPEPAAPDPLAELTAAVVKLAAEVEKHHDRAKHREAVIDNLHAESERLRVGERRGAIRPLLLEFARLRDDLRHQATVLPGQFDRERAQKLLLSFADTIEVTLDNYGVVIESPKQGDDFSVRQHKVVGSTPTADLALVRKIADVRRDGYRDIEVDVPIAQAEVTVYVAAPPPAPEPEPTTPAPGAAESLAPEPTTP
jgi:molecular chaperone GrpE